MQRYPQDTVNKNLSAIVRNIHAATMRQDPDEMAGLCHNVEYILAKAISQGPIFRTEYNALEIVTILDLSQRELPVDNKEIHRPHKYISLLKIEQQEGILPFSLVLPISVPQIGFENRYPFAIDFDTYSVKQEKVIGLKVNMRSESPYHLFFYGLEIQELNLVHAKNSEYSQLLVSRE